MKDYLISVIVPVYNAEKYLNKAVESIVGQTYKNLEIILVDDGARDNSSRMCDDWAAKDKRIRVIHKENGGLVSAWKRGVTEATGEYISFVDSDDWIDDDLVELLSDKLMGTGHEIVSSDYVIEKVIPDGYESKPVYQKLDPGYYDIDSIKSKVIPNILGYENRTVTISRCMKLFSKELLLQNLEYADERIGMAEDMTATIPALLDCEHLTVLDHKAKYHYLYVQESMAHKYDTRMYESITCLMENMKQVLADKNHTDLMPALNREYIFLLLFCVKNESRGNPKRYKENIRKLSKDNRNIIDSTDVEIESLSNKLLYRALKRPNMFNLLILRGAMIAYYRR